VVFYTYQCTRGGGRTRYKCLWLFMLITYLSVFWLYIHIDQSLSSSPCMQGFRASPAVAMYNVGASVFSPLQQARCKKNSAGGALHYSPCHISIVDYITRYCFRLRVTINCHSEKSPRNLHHHRRCFDLDNASETPLTPPYSVPASGGEVPPQATPNPSGGGSNVAATNFAGSSTPARFLFVPPRPMRMPPPTSKVAGNKRDAAAAGLSQPKKASKEAATARTRAPSSRAPPSSHAPPCPWLRCRKVGRPEMVR
jgi:hypothetical protein